MALIKAIAVPLYLPLAWWFVDDPTGWLFTIVPTAWAAQTFWATSAPAILYWFPVGIAVTFWILAMLLPLLRTTGT